MANQIIGRARRSGMNEGMSEQITIKISSARDITQSAQEWLNEMRENNHTPKRLPTQVYNDIMSGTPIVEIVRKEDAQEAIYNTVYAYINHTIKEEIELDVVDSAVADPIQAPAGGKVITLVPGAFKPPHSGHLGMVEQYAQEVASHPAGKVVVLISKPLKSGRKLPNGREITAEDSRQIWEIMTQHLGDNVEVKIANHASPVTAMYEFIGRDGDLEPGTEVVLGVCTKGSDPSRFAQADKYVKEGVILRPLENCAVDPVNHSPEYMNILESSELRDEMPSVAQNKDPHQFHASDMRFLLGQTEKVGNSITINPMAEKLLEDFVGGPDNVGPVLSILGIDVGEQQMEETTTVSAVAGAPGPFPQSTLDRKPRRRRKASKKQKHNENIALSLADEVYELFIERGILT
jgi:hypothetical protein